MVEETNTGVRLSVIETKLDAIVESNKEQHLENKEEHKSILEFLKEELEKKADKDRVDGIVALFTEKIDTIECLLKEKKADWKWILVFITILVQILLQILRG